MKTLNPYVVVFFSSVLILIVSVYSYSAGGPTVLLFCLFLLTMILGLFAGISWPVYPWKVCLYGCVPSLMFFIWRFFTASDPFEQALNESLFVFLPLTSLASAYVGTFFGRRIALKRRRGAAGGDGGEAGKNP